MELNAGDRQNSANPVPLRTQWWSDLADAGAGLVLVLCDLSVFAICFWSSALAIRFVTSESTSPIPWWLAAILALCMGMSGLYTHRLPALLESERTAFASTLAIGVGLIVGVFAQLQQPSLPGLVVITWINLLWALPVARISMKRLLAAMGLWRRQIIVLGTDASACKLLQAFNRETSIGYSVVGFLDDAPGTRGRTIGSCHGRSVQVLGGTSEAEVWMAQLGVFEVAIAMPQLPRQALTVLVNRLRPIAKVVHVVPDLSELPIAGMALSYLFTERTPLLSIRNRLGTRWQGWVKRFFDVVLSVLLLPVILLLLGIVAVMVRLESAGPVFFLDRRLGRGGRLFTCYKFRTMHVASDSILQEYLVKNPVALAEWERYRKLRDADPRVTHVGRLLRKFSLDELPQIFNVLLGDMSLVGPRPYVIGERALMGSQRAVILEVRPGITGLWQVAGRNELSFEQRINLESWYVRNWSLWLDAVLLARTVDVVLTRRGAF